MCKVPFLLPEYKYGIKRKFFLKFAFKRDIIIKIEIGQVGNDMKHKEMVLEFIRYVFVGGFAFIVDFATLALCKEYIFATLGSVGLYLAVFAGFMTGIVANYMLSLWFVFVNDKQKEKGRGLSAFLLFVIIGIIGLGLTELGMWAGVEVVGMHYMITKIGVAAIVLIWNYAARKIFIFK